MSSSTPNANAPLARRLYVLTTSQTPLAPRYPQPRKPRLVLPGLVHRTLHAALDGDQPSVYVGTDEGEGAGRAVVIPHPDSLAKHDVPSQRNGVDGNGSDGPSPPPQETSAEKDSDAIHPSESDHELTVKLHLVAPLSTTGRIASIEQALKLLSSYKGLSPSSIDTFLIGFKGLDYRGAPTAASQMFGCGAEGMEAVNTQDIKGEVEDGIVALWNEITRSGAGAGAGAAANVQLGEKTRIGTLYATLGLLKRLVKEGEAQAQAQEGDEEGRKRKRIAVNALDTPDCHHLPKEYTAYAREKGVELWAGGGGEGSDPLPSAHLHNLLQEFAPKLRSLAHADAHAHALDGPAKGTGTGIGNGKADKLERLIPLREDGLKFADADGDDEAGAEVAVDVQWVLSYTLLSKTRNVVHDKGYIVAADFA